MEVPAHPLTIGQILDRIYHLMRANLRGFLALGAAPMGCFAIVFVAMFASMFLMLFRRQWATHSMSPVTLAALTFLFILFYLGYIVVFAIYQPAASFAALQAELGVAVPLRAAYAFALNKVGRYVGLFLLRLLIVAGPIFGVILLLAGVASVAVALSGSSPQPVLIAIVPVLIFVYAGGMVYGVFMSIRLALVYPACVAEDLTASAAIRRSLQLTRGAMGRIFLVALVVYAAVYVAMMVCEVVLGALAAAVAFPMVLMHASGAAEIAGSVIVGALFVTAFALVMAVSSAAYATAFAVLYRDQRFRTDPRPEPDIVA